MATPRLVPSVTVADMVSGTFPQVGLNMALTPWGTAPRMTVRSTPLVQNVLSVVTPPLLLKVLVPTKHGSPWLDPSAKLLNPSVPDLNRNLAK